MKNSYIIFLFLISCVSIQAQTFEFSLSYLGVNPITDKHQVALLATPSIAITDGVTSDMGAEIYVPNDVTIGNFVSGDSDIPGYEWKLISLGSDDNGSAFFLSRKESNDFSVVLSGDGPFQLVLFDIQANSNPTSGQIKFGNGQPIFSTSFLQSYININLGTGTMDAYSGNNVGANALDFQTLSNPKIENPKDLDFSIYPIPASEFVYIKSNVEILSAELFDQSGKLILRVKESDKINVKELASGVYLLKVELWGMESDIQKKVIIE